MYTQTLVVVLLFGACLAAPQSTITASGAATVEVPPAPAVSLPPVPDVPAGSVPSSSDAIVPNQPFPSSSDLPPAPQLPSLVSLLQQRNYGILADLFTKCPLDTLVPAGTQVTVPGISDSTFQSILASLKDAAGNLDPTKVADFLKSIIIKDIQFKQQLLQAAIGALKNLLDQAQNIRGYNTSDACVWNGGDITQPDIPFAGGLIQGLDFFVPKLSSTLEDLLKGVGGTVGTLVGNVLNLLKPLSTFNYNDIFKNLTSGGNTVILPSASTLTNWLKPTNLLNLPNNFKKFTFSQPWTLADLAQLASAGTGLTNLLGQTVPISLSSSGAHTVTIDGVVYTISHSFTSGCNGNVLTTN